MNRVRGVLDQIDLNSESSKKYLAQFAKMMKEEQHPARPDNLRVPERPALEDCDLEDDAHDKYRNRKPEAALNLDRCEFSQLVDMDRPQVYLMLGRPRSGKSHLTKWLLYSYFDQRRHAKNPPSWVMVFTGSKFNDDYIGMIPENALIEYDEAVFEDYVEYLKHLKSEMRGKMPHSVIVLDDVVGLFSSTNKTFQNFVTIHRHLNCTIIISVQYLLGNVSTTFRECVSCGFLFKSATMNTLKAIHAVFGELFETFAEFKSHFMKATREEHQSMLCLPHEMNIERNYLSFKAPRKLPKGQLQFRQILYSAQKQGPSEWQLNNASKTNIVQQDIGPI